MTRGLSIQGQEEARAKYSPNGPGTFSKLLEPLPLLHLALSRNNQAGRKRWAWALQSHPRGRKGSSGKGPCSPLKPGRKGFTFPPGRHILFLGHPVPLSWLGARAHSFSWWPQATFPLLERLRTTALVQNVGFAAARAGTCSWLPAYPLGQVSVSLCLSLPSLRMRTSFHNRSACTWTSVGPGEVLCF